MDFIFMVFKLIFALIIILGIFLVTLKYSNKGISKIGNKRYVKVVDRMQISKDSYIVILRIGKKGMVLLTNSGHTEKLQELSIEEIEEIERIKMESYENMTNIFNKLISKIKSKEDKDEK
jgi:flagellar protein FliO/FliZ